MPLKRPMLWSKVDHSVPSADSTLRLQLGAEVLKLIGGDPYQWSGRPVACESIRFNSCPIKCRAMRLATRQHSTLTATKCVALT